MTTKMEAQYFKTRRGIGTERTWQPTDWLLVDVGADGEIVGLEILGDHTQQEALIVIASKAHAPPKELCAPPDPPGAHHMGTLRVSDEMLDVIRAALVPTPQEAAEDVAAALLNAGMVHLQHIYDDH